MRLKALFACLALCSSTLFAEQTLSIIKPDAVENGYAGQILAQLEQEGLKISGIKMVQLDRAQAAEFYEMHQDKPFYSELVTFMTSGPIIVQVLEGDNAIQDYRKLMGATNPQDAKPNTLRAQFAESKGRNAVHGSDSEDAAIREISLFFTPEELF